MHILDRLIDFKIMNVPKIKCTRYFRLSLVNICKMVVVNFESSYPKEKLWALHFFYHTLLILLNKKIIRFMYELGTIFNQTKYTK